MKDPQDACVLSARLAKAFPALSAYSAATLAEELCAIERAQRRHAERCCSGEDGGYVRPLGNRERIADEHALATQLVPEKHKAIAFCECDTATAYRKVKAGIRVEHDPDAEERAEKRIVRRIKEWQRRVKGLQDLTGKTGPEAARWDMPDVPITLQSDPRGPVLLLRLPNETEAQGV